MSGKKYQTGAAASRLSAKLNRGQAGAPEAVPEVEKKERKAKLEDMYERKMYWLRKDYIAKVADYAYTERISLKEAMDNIFEIAFAKIEAETQLLHKPTKEDNRS